MSKKKMRAFMAFGEAVNLVTAFQKADDENYELYLYDTVTKYGGFNWKTWEEEQSKTSAAYFKEQLEAIPETAKIVCYINCNGGEVTEGTAIYNMIKRKQCAGKTAYVDGACHSVAGLILQAFDTRIMNLGSSMLVHDMWTCATGNARELRQAADQLDAMMESNRKVFLARATITEEKLIALMEAETILTPAQALEYGLIDAVQEKQTPEVKEEQDQQAKLMQMLLENRMRQIDMQMELAKAFGLDKQPVVPAQPKPISEPKQNTDRLSSVLTAMLHGFSNI